MQMTLGSKPIIRKWKFKFSTSNQNYIAFNATLFTTRKCVFLQIFNPESTRGLFQLVKLCAVNFVSYIVTGLRDNFNRTSLQRPSDLIQSLFINF